jgi:SAM-dependent methyltransferase
MVTMQQFVKWGLDRQIPELLDPPIGGPRINLGPGDRKIIEGTVGVGPRSNRLTDLEWYAGNPLPYDTNTVTAVHAHQFMEHFDAETALGILGEIQRVLVPGGVVFMTTPYPGHGHFTQALDHKTMWTEETWQWLFDNSYYHAGRQEPWKLRVHACFLGGIVYRNLDLFTQLVKVA